MARMIIVMARKMAEYTAFGAMTIPTAPMTTTAPRIQNWTASPVDVRVRGSAARMAEDREVTTAPLLS
jgi:hypothetical protein